MNRLNVLQSTARFSGLLFRNAFPVYAALYDRYKRFTERGEIALIRALVRPGDTVVDVGANVGFYTQVLAECVGSAGRVYAFEPDELNFKRLRLRAQMHPQVQVVRAAVTEKSGRIDLYLSRDLNVDHRTYATDEVRKKVGVDAIALDEFFHDHRDPIAFIKMDIQGAEHAALAGMREVASRSSSLRILMEVWPSVLDRFGAGTEALLALVESWGFAVWLVNGDGTLGERLAAGKRLPDGGAPGAYFSVLCARPQCMGR